MGRMKTFVAVALAAGTLALFGGCTNPVLNAVKAVKLITSVQGDTLYYDAAIAASAGTLYVAYQDPNSNTLKLASSSDNGESWTAPIEIDASTNVGTAPYATVDGTTIYLDYWNGTASVPKWCTVTGGGTGWSPTTGTSPSIIFLRTLTNSTGTYGFYTDKTSLFCAKWSSGSWVAPSTIGAWTSGFPGGDTGRGPWCVSTMANDIFAIAWCNGGQVNCNVTHNYGSAWTAPTQPSASSVSATAVASTFMGSVYCVVYFDATSGHLYFRRSTDEGSTWDAGTSDLGSVTLGSLTKPSSLGIQSSGSTNLAVMYFDGTNAMHTVSSSDGGTTWTAQPVLSQFGASFLDDFQGNNATLYVLTAFNNTTSGVKTQMLVMLKSQDNGATWY